MARGRDETEDARTIPMTLLTILHHQHQGHRPLSVRLRTETGYPVKTQGAGRAVASEALSLMRRVLRTRVVAAFSDASVHRKLRDDPQSRCGSVNWPLECHSAMLCGHRDVRFLRIRMKDRRESRLLSIT